MSNGQLVWLSGLFGNRLKYVATEKQRQRYIHGLTATRVLEIVAKGVHAREQTQDHAGELRCLGTSIPRLIEVINDNEGTAPKC